MRAVTNEDDAFLYEIYKASRAAEFAPLQLPEAQLDSLMRMQYQSREQSYTAQFPDADHAIVSVDDAGVGQIRVNRAAEEHRLVDIALLPAWQGKGIGTLLVSQLIETARELGVPLRCSVAMNNPGSFRFHQRLGFTIIAEDPMYLYLEHSRK